MALIAILAAGLPDLRGLHGLRLSEIELFEPAERAPVEESASPLARTSEDAEEFFSDGAPDARIKGVRLALSNSAHLRRCANSVALTKRQDCAHLPTGPPAA